MSERVLLVEDDVELRRSIALVLSASGMSVTEVADGAAAIEQFDPEGTDVVILDLMLPSQNGFEVCRQIRRSSPVPIVMVTAMDSAEDIVRGLESGADDYVVKPFEAAVLLARLRAVLRRTTMQDTGILLSGDLRVDTAAWRAWRGDTEVHLTSTELRLLTEFVRHPGQVLTREVLLASVWGYDYLGDSRLVDMAILRLRDKLRNGHETGTRIGTVRGVGYRLEP